MSEKGTGERLLPVLFFTLILSVMNATMFNVAMPEIQAEFHLSAATVGWVLSGYIVVYAIGSVTYGKLADQVPLKTLLTIGLSILAAGSLFGLFAQAFWMVMLGRILQSVGASVIPAAAMLIPVRYFAPERRGRALGVVSTGLATGTAIGPILAGAIASFADWRWLFILPALLFLLLPLYRRLLVEDVPQGTRVDWLGGGLLAATIVSLLLAITKGSLLLFALGAILLATLVIQTSRAKQPFLARQLFANRGYVGALVVAFVTTGLIFVLPFTMPQLLHNLDGMKPGEIGLVLAPGAVVAALLGRRVGRLVDERGNRFVFFGAVALMVAAFAVLAGLVTASPWVLALVLVGASVGQVGIQVSMSNTIAGTLPRESAGLGMGMYSMMNFISGAIATTLIGKLIATHTGHAGPSAHGALAHGAASQAAASHVYAAIFIGIAALLVAIGLVRRFQRA
jgi:DHA2 family metal-tetracycline-proton antiporter-like MFS transporter